ncbi:LysM peptidoglycan-binding domain-containing protein [Peribacillus sp. SCS-155]|uniref:LysM peptidoglycan-binding domain-containing protein n=1 Tax=Peribacillus sedimenti TaxID=3115297 RepID=UPI0039065651
MKRCTIKMTALSMGLAAVLSFSNGADAAISKYTIKKGDTLTELAHLHGTSTAALKKGNNLKSDTVHIGDTLKMVKFVTIKKGDTLYSIARQHGMSLDELRTLNKLKSDTNRPGQSLLVSINKSTGSYDVSKIPVSLTVKADFSYSKEEPGKYILLNKKDGDYFVRIEVLDSNASIAAIKKNSSDYLQSTGKVTEIKTNNGHPFYKGASFFLHSHNSRIGQNIVVKRVDGKLVRFTLHYRNIEESEGITMKMLSMLQTARLK